MSDVMDAASLVSHGSSGTVFALTEDADVLTQTYKSACDAAAVKPISSFIKLIQNSSLASVTLDNSYFGDRGLLPILRALRTSKVTCLSMLSCMLTHEHLREVRKQLSGHPCLTSLNLKQNDLGPQSAKHILALLHDTPVLVHIELDDSCPKLQQIKQSSLANSNIHIPLTKCVHCAKCVLGPSLDEVEVLFLKELCRAAKCGNNGAYCNASDQASQATMWGEVRDGLNANGCILSLCGAACLHGWIAHLLAICTAAPPAPPDTFADPNQIRSCSRCGIFEDTTSGFLSTPLSFILEVLGKEVDTLDEVSASMLARFAGKMVSITPGVASVQICSASCARAVVRAGLCGEGGLLPLLPDSRDWPIHDHFGILSVPNTDFCCLDDLRTFNQGEHPLSAAICVAVTCQHGDSDSYDPLYTYVMARSLSKRRNPLQGCGVDLRDVCKSVVKFGVLPSTMAVFGVEDPASRWGVMEEWHRATRGTMPAVHKAAASLRKRAYFAIDPPPQGVDLFDAIRSASYSLLAARRPVLAGVKWRREWTVSPSGLIPYTRFKGGVLHAVRIVGQKMISGIAHLVVVPCLGSAVGEQGTFHFSREVVNREFRYGCFAFRDMGHLNSGLNTEKLMESSSQPTKAIMRSRPDVEAVVEILSTPSARKCEILHKHFMPLIKNMPLEALFLFRSKNIIATQREEELLAAVKRLYKAACQAQIVFFWECQASLGVREWIVELLSAYDDVKHARSHSLKRGGTTFKLRRPSAASLGGAQAVQFDPSLRPLSSRDSQSNTSFAKNRKGSVESPDPATKNWEDSQKEKSKQVSERASKAEALFTKTLAATMGLQRLSIFTSRNSSAVLHSGCPLAVSALVRAGLTTSFLQFTRGTDNARLSTTSLFFFGANVANIDVRNLTLPVKYHTIATHPQLGGFPFKGGFDTVAYASPFASQMCYVFSASVWVAYNLGDRLTTMGPHLIGGNPKFWNLPPLFHGGVDCCVSVPKTAKCYFVKGADVCLWDLEENAPIKNFKIGEQDFANIPAEFNGRISSCIYLGDTEGILCSAGYSCLWDFATNDLPPNRKNLFTPFDPENVIHHTPPHTRGDLTPVMRRACKMLLDDTAFESHVLYGCVSSGEVKKAGFAMIARGFKDKQKQKSLGLQMESHEDGKGYRPFASLACSVSYSGMAPVLEEQDVNTPGYPQQIVQTLLVEEVGYVPYHSEGVLALGVLRLKAASSVDSAPALPGSIYFTFKTPQDFGYFQVCGVFKTGVTLHIEHSVNGVIWTRLLTTEARLCVTDGSWGERVASAHWRILFADGSAGDVVHRVFWYTVTDLIGARRYNFLKPVSFSTPVQITACAPVIMHPDNLCPKSQISDGTSLISWEQRNKKIHSADPSPMGWYRKHCVVPLLNAKGTPSDVALFVTGVFFTSWSYPDEAPLQLSSCCLHNSSRFTDLPRPFRDVGFDAVLYKNPAESSTEVYLFSDAHFVLWDMMTGVQHSEVGLLGVDPPFHKLPSPFSSGLDSASNLFQSGNECALFRERAIIFYNIETQSIVKGPFKIGSGIHRGADILCGIPQWTVAEENFSIAKLPPSAGDGYCVFSGARWMHMSAENGIYLGPFDITTHRRYIKLSGVLGWHVLEKNASIMVDLKGHPQLFVGCSIYSPIGESEKTTFEIQYSDDSQVWGTCAEMSVKETGTVTWVLAEVQNTSHRFWRVLLSPFVPTSVTKIEWLKLPSRRVHTVPAEVTTTAEVEGNLDLLFAGRDKEASLTDVEAVFQEGDSITYFFGVALVDSIKLHCEVLDLYGTHSLRSVRSRCSSSNLNSQRTASDVPDETQDSSRLRTASSRVNGSNSSRSPRRKRNRVLPSIEGCKWEVHASKDEVEWKLVGSIVCFGDGDSEASWDPFESWKFWRLTLVKGQCILRSIQSSFYSGPLATSSQTDEQISIYQQALLVMDSGPGTCEVNLTEPTPSLVYDFKDTPKSFVRVSIDGTFQRGLTRRIWSVEQSNDGKKWAIMAEQSPAGTVAELSWCVMPPARYWRVRASGDATLRSIRWMVPQASLGLSQAAINDELTVTTTGEVLKTRSLASLCLAESMTGANPGTVALSCKHHLLFTSQHSKNLVVCGLRLRSSFKGGRPTERIAVRVEMWRASDTEPGKWVGVMTHHIEGEHEQLSWGYAGESEQWRLQLIQGERLCVQACAWEGGGFAHCAVVEPECVECSDATLQHQAEAVCLYRESPTPTAKLYMTAGLSVTLCFASPTVVKLFNLTATGSYELQVMDDENDSEWRTVASGTRILSCEDVEQQAVWRLCALGDGHLSRITAIGVSLGRSVSSVEPRHFTTLSRGPELQVVEQQASNKRLLQATMSDDLKAFNQEAKDVSKKIGKYFKDRKAQIRVSGVDFCNLAQTCIVPGRIDELSQALSESVFHIKDFKLMRPFDIEDISNGFPRLDYRGESGAGFKGIVGTVMLSFLWNKKAPLREHTVTTFITLSLSEEWKPIGTFPLCPSLLYLIPPTKGKSLAVISVSGVAVNADSRLFVPANDRGDYGVSFGTEECAFNLPPGIAIIGEVQMPQNPTRPILQLLRLLMPDDPVTGHYHVPSFADKHMTLWLEMGCFNLDLFNGKTENVHVEIKGSEDLLYIRVRTVVVWRGLRFAVSGDVMKEDEGSLRITGPLISGEWKDLHGLAGARYLDLTMDVAFAPPADSPDVLSVLSASISGSILFKGTSSLSSRFRIDISQENTLTGFCPYIALTDIPQLCYAATEVPHSTWLTRNITVEDVSFSLPGVADRESPLRQAVEGKLKLFSSSGDCTVVHTKGSGGEPGLTLQATLNKIRLGIMEVDSLESGGGVSTEILFANGGRDVSVLFSGCTSIVGVKKVPTTIKLTDTDVQFHAETCVGGLNTLRTSLRGSGLGQFPSLDDFLVEGELGHAKIQAALHDITLQLPLIQGIVGAGLLFTLRLDGLKLLPFRLSCPMLCVRFVGVLMGSDFDLIATLDVSSPTDFLPNVASEIIEQCWAPLLGLYQEFTSTGGPRKSEDGGCYDSNSPVLLFHEYNDDVLKLSDDDW